MNSLKYRKAIFFDLDGVILDTESLYFDLMTKYNQKNNLSLSKKYYINHLLGKSKQEISKILKKKWKEKYNEEKYWKGLLEFRGQYLKSNKVKIKKGFNELVLYLKQNNYYIAIVSSNSFVLVEQLLSDAGINKGDFNSIVTRENVKNLKPHSDLYEYAISESKIERNNIIAIEDSIVGIMSAINAKLDVICIPDMIKKFEVIDKNGIIFKKSLFDVKKYLMGNGETNGNLKK